MSGAWSKQAQVVPKRKQLKTKHKKEQTAGPILWTPLSCK